MGSILCAGTVKMHIASIDINQLAGGVRGFRRGEEGGHGFGPDRNAVRSNPNSSIAARTLAAVFGLTSVLPLIAQETVARETPPASRFYRDESSCLQCSNTGSGKSITIVEIQQATPQSPRFCSQECFAGRASWKKRPRPRQKRSAPWRRRIGQAWC